MKNNGSNVGVSLIVIGTCLKLISQNLTAYQIKSPTCGILILNFYLNYFLASAKNNFEKE